MHSVEIFKFWIQGLRLQSVAMEESPYVVFLGFAFVWVLLGISGLFLLMRSEGQQMKMPPAALIVVLPILIAFAVALTFGALSM